VFNLQVLKAVDTETTSDGKARIIADEERFICVNSFEDIAEFLRPRLLKANTIFESWNLGFDTRAIIKWLPVEYWEPLYNGDYVEYEEYKMRLLGGKKFSIGYEYGKTRSRHRYVHFYDMAAFYGYQKLDDAAKQYLGKSKQDTSGWVEFVRTHRNPEEEMHYLSQHVNEVGEYCRLDCELTLALSKYMLGTLEGIGVDVKNPISPASLAGKLMQSKNTPDYPDSQYFLTERFTQPTFRGGFFSCMKRGKFDQPVYEYDISSAYPAVQSQLPHWDNGVFTISEDANEIWDAPYGWVLANFDCEWVPYQVEYPQYIEIDYSDGRGFQNYLINTQRIFYPVGPRIQPITLLEAKWMREKGYPIVLLNGLIWNQTNETHKERPFAYLEEMFKERLNIIKQNGKDDMRQYAIKILINSTYGKTVQSPAKYGYRVPTVDFGYGSYITAQTRLQVAEAALAHPGQVIEIATDAVYLLEEAPELDTPDEKTLGTWELASYEGGLWIGGGIKQLWQDGKSITKARGFTKDRHFDLEAELRNVANDSTYAHYKQRPITLGECLRAFNNPKLFNPNILNTFQRVGRRLSVNMDSKRCWERTPKNWGEFLEGPIDSMPWTIDELIDGVWVEDRP